MNKIIKQKGFSLVELLVAFSIFLIFVTAVMGVFQMSFKTEDKAIENERAVFLAQEGVEIIKNIRDKDFNELVNGTHGLIFGPNGWELASTQDTIDIFTRSIEISTVESNVKKADITISWPDSDGQKTYTLNSYLTNWRLFTPTSGITLRKVIVNRTSANTVSDFAPYSAETTIEDVVNTFTFNHANTIESPIGTYTFSTLNVDPGIYTISETQNSSYTTTFADDCAGTGQINLGVNESKICTIINEENIQTITYNVTRHRSGNHYIIDGLNDPTLSLTVGVRYVFNINSPGQPFWIKVGRATRTTGTSNAYNTGVQNNGIDVGQIIFDIPAGAPTSDLYYISQNTLNMSGDLNINP